MLTLAYVKITQLLRDESGLTAVEYAVLGGIIVTALIGIGISFTGELEDKFDSLIP